MTPPPPDRLTKVLVGLLVLTGILRVWVIVDTFQLADRQKVGNEFSYWTMVHPLLQHLPLAGLAVVTGVGLLRQAAFAIGLPFWIGMFSVFAIDGRVTWAPWNLLAATPLTCTGLLYLWRARKRDAFWSCASGGIIVALVSPTIAVNLAIFLSTSDFVLLGGVLSAVLLASFRSPRGYRVHLAFSVLFLVLTVVDTFDWQYMVGMRTRERFVEPEWIHALMALAGVLGCLVALPRARTAWPSPGVHRTAPIFALWIGLSAVAFEVVPSLGPKKVPTLIHPDELCSRSDGGVEVYWYRPRKGRFRLGDGPGDGTPSVGLDGGATTVFATSNPPDMETVLWVLSKDGEILDRSTVDGVRKCTPGESFEFAPAEAPDRTRLRLGDRIVEVDGKVSLFDPFYSRVMTKGAIHGWPRFVPIVSWSSDWIWVRSVDRDGGEPVDELDVEEPSDLGGCDSSWCVLGRLGRFTFIDGNTGKMMVTIKVSETNLALLVTIGGGHAWFESVNGRVCTTSYADPTRVRCIDTDQVPEVIDHRQPDPVAPAAPNR